MFGSSFDPAGAGSWLARDAGTDTCGEHSLQMYEGLQHSLAPCVLWIMDFAGEEWLLLRMDQTFQQAFPWVEHDAAIAVVSKPL